jgi:hypothetical protein
MMGTFEEDIILYQEGSWIVERSGEKSEYAFVTHIHTSLPLKGKSGTRGWYYGGEKCWCGLTPPDSTISLCTMLNLSKPKYIFWRGKG